VVNAGIGDSDSLVTDEHAGVLVLKFDAEEYARAATEILDLAGQPEIRRRMRGVAAKLFDVRRVGVERYARLYERVFRS